jgi:magnesium chelatase subunit D
MAVRALALLMPSIEVVEGCPFLCDPENHSGLCNSCTDRIDEGQKLNTARRQVTVVELPIGATEDRVVGTLDIERAIKSGERHFEPGVLAAANRGILYIDEVNLLDDHLVDILLDAAAMGVNFVEREGISFSHPAKFILTGTMNPEEGELRPQLLDRFGLAVEVTGIQEPEARAEIVRRRIAFEEDPESFIAEWEENQERTRRQVAEAKALLPQVRLGNDILELITRICIDFAVDGHRADIVIHKTASAIAAYEGRTEVNEDDVREAAELALLHRRRRQPFEEPELDSQQLDDSIKDWQQEQDDNPENNNDNRQGSQPDNSPGNPPEQTDYGDSMQSEHVFDSTPPYKVKPLSVPVTDGNPRDGSGRRSRSITDSKTGRYAGSRIPQGKTTDLAIDATLRAAAPFQTGRKRETPGQNALIVKEYDLREKVRQKKIGNLIIFVLDASGSMAAEERMSAAKGAVLSLLLDAYQRRDRVGMVVFRGDDAELVLPPTGSVTLAQKLLARLPTGGRTPLAHGLKAGLDTIKESLLKDKNLLPMLVLISDGRANVSIGSGNPVEDAERIAGEIRAANIRSVAIDTEQDFISFGLVRKIAGKLEGIYLRIRELEAAPIASAVRNNLN